MIVDAHQHFWSLSRGDYAWPNDQVAPIFRDFAPDDLAPLLRHAGVQKTILVQATDSTAETAFLLSLARRTDFVAGVVGWVDLAAEDTLETIDHLRGDPLLVGLRPMLQNLDDTNWVLSPAVHPALAHMERTGLCFDALIQPRHLPVIAELAVRFPHLPIVIDHIAKPAMGAGKYPTDTWQRGMTALAAQDNVMCKLSGMVTEAGPGWRGEDLMPFAQVVLDLFGAKRLMFGSDWPVVNLAGDYGSWLQFIDAFLAPLTTSERADIMAGSACRFYGIHLS